MKTAPSVYTLMMNTIYEINEWMYESIPQYSGTEEFL